MLTLVSCNAHLSIAIPEISFLTNISWKTATKNWKIEKFITNKWKKAAKIKLAIRLMSISATIVSLMAGTESSCKNNKNTLKISVNCANKAF